jgi:methanogenic corrinoid protein MtbC1
MKLRNVGDNSRRTPHPGFRRAPVQSFLKAALLGDHVAAAEIALAFMSQMRSRTTVIVDLFDAAQQAIGQRWRIGTATSMDEYRVSQAIEAASAALPRDPPPVAANQAPNALLVTARSEQHNLGLYLLAMAFSDHGWIVRVRPGVVASNILQLNWREWPSLVAISATYDSGNLRSQLKTLVREVTLHNIPIIVGGSAFIRRPELAAEVGSTLVARDARVGVIMAGKLSGRYRRHLRTQTTTP